jgi:chromosome segregation ATPase
MKTMAELTAQFERERTALGERVRQLTETATKWEHERARLNNECDEANRQLEEARAELMRIRAEMNDGKDPLAKPTLKEQAIQTEIHRVESAIADLTSLIDDPLTELSTVIRKKVERTELHSYLKGIRFALYGK